MTVPLSRKDYFRRYLCPFWLRPESALWYSYEAFAVRAFLGDFKQPSLEIGCTDGTSSFVMLGGEFLNSFDVYSDVSWKPDSIHWNSMKEDYYDIVHPKNNALIVQSSPSQKWTLGVCGKKSHLEKARRLEIYEQVKLYPTGKPLTLLPGNPFETIWAPNLYWNEDLEGFLQEIKVLLAPKGRLLTVVPDRSALEHMLFRSADLKNETWWKDLDRGRFENTSRHARKLNEWEHFFEQAGFEITRKDHFLPVNVLRIHDIGLRPLFPVLMNIYDTLKTKLPEDWLKIKNQWIDTFLYFLSPFCDSDQLSSENAVWHLFELQSKVKKNG
ncbi:MAG: hypothetical protein EXS63_07625 [Candidatus Omnitrophica bacterium]|nr:hypothetical protein [Candidatus Omnitrophota bacterium]